MLRQPNEKERILPPSQSPTSVTVDFQPANLPSPERLERVWSSKILQHKPSSEIGSCCSDYVGLLAPLGLFPSNNFFDGVLLGPPLFSPQVLLLCQEVPAAAAINAGSLRPRASPSSSVAASTRISSKLKAEKKKTSMCDNWKKGCRFGGKCAFAHSHSELKCFPLHELKKGSPNYLSRPCWLHVTFGDW